MPPRGALIVGGEMSIAAAADVAEAQAAPTITTGISMRVQRSIVFSQKVAGHSRGIPIRLLVAALVFREKSGGVGGHQQGGERNPLVAQGHERRLAIVDDAQRPEQPKPELHSASRLALALRSRLVTRTVHPEADANVSPGFDHIPADRLFVMVL